MSMQLVYSVALESSLTESSPEKNVVERRDAPLDDHQLTYGVVNGHVSAGFAV